MELHDSRILEVGHCDDGTGFLLFDGVVYRSDGAGIPGQDAQESGWQNVRMLVTGMTVEGPAFEPDAYVHDGDLTVNGVRIDNLIPFTASIQGIVNLSMCVAYDFEMRTIRGTSICIEAEGAFVIEAVWDGEGNRTRAG